MCHPGLPVPHGERQRADSGSLGLAPFQSAKSRGSIFAPPGPLSGSATAPGVCLVSVPYARQLLTSK